MSLDNEHPGMVLARMLEERGWSQTDLAAILRRPKNSISQIINGRKAITPETAVGLSLAFGNDAEFWTSLEATYRLSITEADKDVAERAFLYSVAPVADLLRRGWIDQFETVDQLRKQLESFFDSTDLESACKDVVAHTKKTDRVAGRNPEQNAWCVRAKTLASSLQVAKFTSERFEAGVGELNKLVARPESVRFVPRVLAEMGIRFVVIEPLPRTRIDGASLWLNENAPVIALSLRYDRIDSFWHTLGHELSHIWHRDGEMIDSEGLEHEPVLAEIEERADREAVEYYMDQAELDDFIVRVGPLYNRARINQFANRIKVHPGIIVGQLQHRGELKYSQLRDTLTKVREFIIDEALTDGWGYVST